jgi:L-iditol 2-dehydrogenase
MMNTLLYSDWEQVEIAPQPAPTPAPDEVLLRVAACGLCGSELEAFKNRSPRRVPPLVLGHEFCGTIEESGAQVLGWQTGQRAVSNSLVACLECERCKRGDTHLCARRQIFGMNRPGAFAPLVAVPARCLIPWPEHLPARAACLAEPLANGVHVAHLLQKWAGERAVETAIVFGAGPIGLMCLQTLQVLLGARVGVVDLSPERLEVARQLGAASTCDPREGNVPGWAKDFSGGEGVDACVDAAGVGPTKAASIASVRAGGACVWIGLGQNEVALPTFDITLPEIAILGSYASTQDEMAQAVAMLASGQVEAQQWTHVFPLEEGVHAFERMLAARGGDIKAVILPNG